MNKDYQIISLLKKGDEKTIQHFYKEHKSEFSRFASRYEMAKDEISDVYQDAFIALCENARKGKLDELNSSLKTYFFAIGKYMIFGKMKSEKPAVLNEELKDFQIEWETESDLEPDENVNLLRDNLKKLGGQCQQILTLFYYEEKKLDHITEIMKYENKDVAKSQKARCLKKLKELIKNQS
ncbi:RNA polymerase sigma factor [Moheibacter lacus]|uniref:Sigma-70 family RNA polymerase sigma factor n=1 Tax=Moheibacter lacus TaxID=2745851 RepID=A0A838ZTV6_9FLAO|nr:sigma-70 family RNA polymerase sigma factor [Moheibacter lacus]MBA5630401.1 sigma-70 family RNA polymerase sigma factor [Moheibacter lacus]